MCSQSVLQCLERKQVAGNTKDGSKGLRSQNRVVELEIGYDSGRDEKLEASTGPEMTTLPLVEARRVVSHSCGRVGAVLSSQESSWEVSLESRSR